MRNIIFFLIIITTIIIINYLQSDVEEMNQEQTIITNKYPNNNPIKKKEFAIVINKFTWTQPSNCKYKQSSILLDIFKKNNISKNNINNIWNLYIPCTYNNINKEIKCVIDNNNNNNNKFVFLIENSDALIRKEKLWTLILDKYGIAQALTIMPDTYILQNINKYDNQYIRLIQNYSSNKVYIMKKNIQQQKGIKLTNKLEDILNGYKNKYVICQELLVNPYLINGHKINLRIYLLLIYYDNKLTGYMHNNGFMYYTPDKFNKNSLEISKHITTGYIDREIYQRNPLTLEDFRNYLDKSDRKYNSYEKILKQNNQNISSVLFDRIKVLFGKILYAAENEIFSINKMTKLNKFTQFQLFGADIAVSDNLLPLVMEINKGPDMNGKDVRDKNVKTKVLQDMLDILKIINNDNNNKFEKIEIKST